MATFLTNTHNAAFRTREVVDKLTQLHLIFIMRSPMAAGAALMLNYKFFMSAIKNNHWICKDEILFLG